MKFLNCEHLSGATIFMARRSGETLVFPQRILLIFVLLSPYGNRGSTFERAPPWARLARTLYRTMELLSAWLISRPVSLLSPRHNYR